MAQPRLQTVQLSLLEQKSITETKQSREKTNRLAIRIEVEHKITKQSRQSVNNSPSICNRDVLKRAGNERRFQSPVLGGGEGEGEGEGEGILC